MNNRFMALMVDIVTLSISTLRTVKKTEPLRPAPSMYDAVDAVRKGKTYEEVVQNHIQ